MFCYDISEPKRLTKTAKVLENYGIRVQKSFFQCEMEKNQMEVLRDKLLKIIDKNLDSLYIYPICDKCSKKVQITGLGDVIKISTFEIL